MKSFLILFFVATANILFAQKSISGQITDKKKNPIPNVRVLAVDTDVETLTDSNGFYRITVPDGFLVLSFTKNNLKTQFANITGETIDIMMTSVNYSEMSLEELLSETNVSIASGIKQKTNEAPAIVSIITRDEIDKYGARDLSDILRLVPGFEFGLDVNSLIGATFRGIWAFEGRISFMLNGTCINEMGFGLFNFFGTIPAGLIDRIEIIRGQGSSLYGGFAEVAVINIVTKKGNMLKNGSSINVNGGVLGDGALTGSSNVSLGYASANNETEIAAHVGYGYSLLSTKDYVPFISYNHPYFGQTTPTSESLKNTSDRQATYQIIDGRFKNFKFDFIRNSLNFGAQNSWFIRPQVKGNNGEDRNHTVIGSKVSYNVKIRNKISIIPLLEYVQTNLMATPRNPAISHQGYYRNPSLLFQRYRGELLFKYKDKIMVGSGFWQDHAHSILLDGNPGFQKSPNKADTTNKVKSQSYYLILQYSDKFKNLGLTIGSRFEFTSWGNATAPRIGLTYSYRKWNFKMLHGSSYRVPMLFQAYTRAWAWTSAQSEKLKPEKAITFELESEFHPNENLNIKLNVFHIRIHDPLVFHESYLNAGNVETIGAEGEMEMKVKNNGVKCNISYAKPFKNNSDDFLTADKQGFIGIAPLKINLMIFKTIKKLTLSTTGTYLSERKGASQNYAQQLFDGTPNIQPENKTYQSIFLINFNILIKDLIKKHLNINASVYNILNSNYVVIQPYYDLGAPMPLNDRHFVINLTWKLGA